MKKIVIDSQKIVSCWDGFGTSIAWWGNAMKGFKHMEPSKWGKKNGYSNLLEEFMHLLFNPSNGLGLNIVRYNVGGGDNNELGFITRCGAKIPGYRNEEGVYHWKADQTQLTVLKMAYEMISATDQKFYNTLISYSPPYFMTYSGSSTGSVNGKDDNLKWSKYEEFANYLLNVAEFIEAKAGVPVTEIAPVNEPASGYWVYGSLKQEGCQFNSTPQYDIHKNDYNKEEDLYDPKKYSAQSKIYEIMNQKLQNFKLQGKLCDVTLTGMDETNVTDTIQSFENLTDLAKQAIDKISYHTYDSKDRIKLKKLAQDFHKKLWMSEVCFGGKKRNEKAMDDAAFLLAKGIINDINECEATGWIIWQAVEDMAENIKYDSNWGLIHCLLEDSNPLMAKNGKILIYNRGDYYTTKQYYVMGQFSKYIKNGNFILESSESDMVAAFDALQQRYVIVVLNDDKSEKTWEIVLKNKKKINSAHMIRTSDNEAWSKVNEFFIRDNCINVIMKGESVSTIIVE